MSAVGRSSLFPPNLQLASAVVALAEAALGTLDLTKHASTHPRIGVVDHISCHPLTDFAPLHETATLARTIGKPSTTFQLSFIS